MLIIHNSGISILFNVCIQCVMIKSNRFANFHLSHQLSLCGEKLQLVENIYENTIYSKKKKIKGSSPIDLCNI